MAPNRKVIIPPAMAGTAERFRYSPGIVVGNLLFISGQVGRDAAGRAIEDPERQFVTACENVGLILDIAGASYGDVVDLTTYHTTMEDLALFADVKARFFQTEPYPAWTAIEVSALALPGLRVEVKCIAAVSSA